MTRAAPDVARGSTPSTAELPRERSQDRPVRDPVCGMLVNPGPDTPRLEYGERVFTFCSSGCRSRFDRVPERFAGSPVHEGPMESQGLTADFIRHCPECAEQVRVAFEPTAMLGHRSIDEVETVARHRWNRRAPISFANPGRPASLVRALLVLGLGAESPVRRLVAQHELDAQLGRMLDALMTAPAIRREMRALTRALATTLADSGLAADARKRLIIPIEKLVANGMLRALGSQGARR